MANATQKISNRSLKSYSLFVQTPLFIAALKVAIPGILIGVMSGLFIFGDQLLLSNLIPNDPKFSFENIFGVDQSTIQNYIETYNNTYSESLKILDPAGLVKSAFAISSPLTAITNALPYLTGVGAGIIYTQSIARGSIDKAHQIFKTSFYTTLITSLILCILMAGFTTEIINVLLPKTTTINEEFIKNNPEMGIALSDYFAKSHELQHRFAYNYLFLMSFALFFNMFVYYFSFMIRAEGRMLFPMVISIVTIAINLLLDFIFIKFAHIGMSSSAAAAMIGWATNVVACVIYIQILVKKQKTWLSFKYLKLNNGVSVSAYIIFPVLILGLSVFARNIANSVSSMLFQSGLANLKDGQYFQSLSGTTNPIMSLFLTVIFGCSDGIRSLISFNYSCNEIKRVRKAYWATIGITLTYGIIMTIALFAGLDQAVISIFISSNNADYVRYLDFHIPVISGTAICVSCLAIFQSTNRIASSCVSSVTQGLITYPIIWAIICAVVGKGAEGSMAWLYCATNSINCWVAAFVLFAWSCYFVHLKLAHLKVNIKVDGVKHKLVVPFMVPKVSLAQKVFASWNKESKSKK